jgi:3-methyl-2-oxobutanoate hydroxymethyltransferase
VLVWHDLLGFAGTNRRSPKFVREYAALELDATAAIERFCSDVRAGAYPSSAETYHMTDQMADALGLYGGTTPEPELTQ